MNPMAAVVLACLVFLVAAPILAVWFLKSEGLENEQANCVVRFPDRPSASGAKHQRESDAA